MEICTEFKDSNYLCKGYSHCKGTTPVTTKDSNVSSGPQYTRQVSRRVGRPGSVLGKGGGAEGESVCSHRKTITQAQEQLCKAKQETKVLFRVINEMKAQK